MVLLLALPAAVQAEDYNYTTNNGTITVTKYTGPGGAVTIPGTINGLPVTSIGDGAFYGCTSLASVTIGNSVTSLGEAPFSYCISLTAITVDTNNPVYSSVDGVLFNKNQTALIQYPAGKAGSQYTIPDSVTTIEGSYGWGGERGAFAYCTSLTSVTIGNSVTSIGEAAFSSCTSLTSITIPNSVSSIGEGLFHRCFSLTSITIPNSVTSIGYMAFSYCISLTNATLGNSVTTIVSSAFYFCTSLTNVTIPNSVTTLGFEAFSGCTSLTGVNFLGNAPSLGGPSVFSGANNATVYYLPGTTGWGTTFEGRPTALWVLPYPLILNNGPGFGIQTNRFGFIISWATNVPVVVEASTNLGHSMWLPVSTNALAEGSSYFSDPEWTNYPGRFYRLRSP
jgi:hypothetical protein